MLVLMEIIATMYLFLVVIGMVDIVTIGGPLFALLYRLSSPSGRIIRSVMTVTFVAPQAGAYCARCLISRESNGYVETMVTTLADCILTDRPDLRSEVADAVRACNLGDYPHE